MNNKLIDKYNAEIAYKLNVEPLKIIYQVSNKAKSKYGHCRYVAKEHSYIINLSSWILNTEMEKDTICHELCHAYDHAYFGMRTNPHGRIWRALMSEVFGYKNVKAQGIHNKEIKLVKVGINHYNLYENDNMKAIFKINNGLVEIRDKDNKYFECQNNEEYYMKHFIETYRNAA